MLCRCSVEDGVSTAECEGHSPVHLSRESTTTGPSTRYDVGPVLAMAIAAAVVAYVVRWVWVVNS